jgi:hypothetical protein
MNPTVMHEEKMARFLGRVIYLGPDSRRIGKGNLSMLSNLIQKAGHIARVAKIGHESRRTIASSVFGASISSAIIELADWIWNNNDAADGLDVIVRQGGWSRT